VPDAPAKDTFRYYAWAKGTSSTNTSGFAWVGIHQKSGANGTGAVSYSSSSFVGTTIDYNTGTTGSESASSNGYFNSGDWGSGQSGKQYRPVACGLRVRYTGPERYRGGRIILLHHPEDADLDGTTSSDLLAFGEVANESFADDDWHMVSWTPTHTAADFFSSSHTAITGGGTMDIAIIIENGSGQSVGFEWEARWFYEVAGNTPAKTPSEADPVGYSAVVSVAQQKGEKSIWNQGIDAARKEVSNFLASQSGRILVPAVKTAMAAAPLLTGNVAGAALGVGSQIAGMLT
jgi:hypothetical protein